MPLIPLVPTGSNFQVVQQWGIFSTAMGNFQYSNGEFLVQQWGILVERTELETIDFPAFPFFFCFLLFFCFCLLTALKKMRLISCISDRSLRVGTEKPTFISEGTVTEMKRKKEELQSSIVSSGFACKPSARLTRRNNLLRY